MKGVYQTVIPDDLGKKAEAKIKAWLDRPAEGYCIDRVYDQLSGFYGSKNLNFSIGLHVNRY